MTFEQRDVEDFMTAAGQECPKKPTEPVDKIKYLRGELIHEEWKELLDAMGISEIDGQIRDWVPSTQSDPILVADALADLLYVVIGTAVAYGIELQPIWDEVHRSNMSKFIDGHRREDGKWIKGPSYSPADLEPIIKQQQLL